MEAAGAADDKEIRGRGTTVAAEFPEPSVAPAEDVDAERTLTVAVSLAAGRSPAPREECATGAVLVRGALHSISTYGLSRPHMAGGAALFRPFVASAA